MVVLISPRSLPSDQVTREIVRAVESSKATLPLSSGNIRMMISRGRRPGWKQAMAAANAMRIPPDRVPTIIPALVAGLSAKGSMADTNGHPPPPAAPPKQNTGTYGTGRSSCTAARNFARSNSAGDRATGTGRTHCHNIHAPSHHLRPRLPSNNCRGKRLPWLAQPSSWLSLVGNCARPPAEAYRRAARADDGHDCVAIRERPPQVHARSESNDSRRSVSSHLESLCRQRREAWSSGDED